MFTEHEHGPVPMTDMGIVPSDDNDDNDGDVDYDSMMMIMTMLTPPPGWSGLSSQGCAPDCDFSA